MITHPIVRQSLTSHPYTAGAELCEVFVGQAAFRNGDINCYAKPDLFAAPCPKSQPSTEGVGIFTLGNILMAPQPLAAMCVRAEWQHVTKTSVLMPNTLASKSWRAQLTRLVCV